MFIAHLPSGYIGMKLMKVFYPIHKLLFFFGCLGAIFPDLDMFYFYFIDNRQHLHHTYITHWPVLWFSLLLVSILIKPYSFRKYLRVFSFFGCLHIFLDSVVGDICWFAPVSFQGYSLFEVKSVYSIWWLNFILHWSFVLELLILTIALWMFFHKAIAVKK